MVFDEIHYMQDRERGVVWEETIIFLPREVRMVRQLLGETVAGGKAWQPAGLFVMQGRNVNWHWSTRLFFMR